MAVITDRTVAELHGRAMLEALDGAGVEPEVAVVPPGEQHKTLAQTLELLDRLTGTQLTRRDVIVTFGGGVINDMGGWVASCYMRGIPYVNLPTTLVGPGRRRHRRQARGQPHQGEEPDRRVLPAARRGFVRRLLGTLERRQLCAGLAESIKKAIITSPA